MVKAKLTEDGKWIMTESDSKIESDQLRLAFTKKIPSWFIVRKKSPYARIDEAFMNRYGMIPSGLWLELANTCVKYGYALKFSDDFNCRIKNCSITYGDFKKYVDGLFANSDMTPMEYQVEGIYNILNYHNCCVEVSTSGGKTLMTYIIFKFMKEVLGYSHILYVTPRTDLTTQSSDKFSDYDFRNRQDADWTVSEIHATAKKKDVYDDNIVFGNYQSLCRKPAEFFERFDVLIVDECHHSKSKSIRNIITKCCNVKYKIGLTGTFPAEGSYDNFVLQSYLGPVIYRLTSFDLINKENFATPVHVCVLNLKYLDDARRDSLYFLRANKDKDDPTVGGRLLTMEKDIMRDNPVRFKYACGMIMKATRNTLAIFSDVQNSYGRRIYQYVKENSAKNVYYIDGDVPPAARNEMKEAMEADTSGNTVIVASAGTFTEGIDIANLWNIFLLETTKSEITMAQLLGRGMRRYPGKERTMLVDFVDDYRVPYSRGGSQAENYLYRHGKDRQAIYKNRGFPYQVVDVDLNASGTGLF